ncbi:MAG: SPOR domain-containing protein [Flavobacteriales bacterium]|nr:SPOR domain-containing protein [Flavobacteriales bacterium]
MVLSKYISELLLEHNCVIVPQFGGFVGNHVPAKIDRLKNKFQPPSKEISFNQNLVKNDGLLINHIAESLNVSYSEADNSTTLSVELLKKTLNSEKSIQLKDIGCLFFDQENNLHFEPCFDLNYSLNAYGLSSFHVTSIEKKEILRQEVIPVTETVKPKEAKIIPITAKIENTTKTTWKRVAIAAVLFPFIFYAGWLSFSTELFQGTNFAYADLNPFTKKICPVYKVRGRISTNKVEELKAAFNLNIQSNVMSFSLFGKSEKQFDSTKMITAYLAKTKIVNTAVKKPTIKAVIYKFHIIAGCFGVYRNAERLAAKLRKKGFNSAIIDKKNGLYRVAFQSFTKEADAEKSLVKIKASQNRKAWLLEK